MEINDILHILNLTQAEINALGAVDSGTIVYNSTTNALETYTGTAWVAASGGGSDVFITGGTFSATTLTLDKNDGNDVTITGFTSGGGNEPYITEQDVWMHQILGDTQGSLNNAFNLTLTKINATPIMFNQDVNLNKIVTESSSTQTSNTGHVAIYELISKSEQSGVEYYQFDLLQKFTPTFVFNSAGVQEITLSPVYKMLAGKVYVIVMLLEQTGSFGTQQVTGRYRVTYNSFLGKDYRVLETTTTQGYNPFTNNLPTSMPSSLYMYPQSGQNMSIEPFSIKIQNA